MTAPQLTRPSLAPVAAAWLAGGLQRAVDALLVSRLEHRRIAVVDGNVADRGLDRDDALDGALLDALGARGSRDLETVRWRVSRDRRLERLCVDLVVEGLLGDRSAWGRSDRVRTGSGRRLLRELRGDPPVGAAWEVALHGRAGLTDLSLREALEPPARPPLPPQARGSWLDRRRQRDLTAEGYASGAAVVGHGGWGGLGGSGGDCGGFDGGGGDGGGC